VYIYAYAHDHYLKTKTSQGLFTIYTVTIFLVMSF